MLPHGNATPDVKQNATGPQVGSVPALNAAQSARLHAAAVTWRDELAKARTLGRTLTGNPNAWADYQAARVKATDAEYRVAYMAAGLVLGPAWLDEVDERATAVRAVTSESLERTNQSNGTPAHGEPAGQVRPHHLIMQEWIGTHLLTFAITRNAGRISFLFTGGAFGPHTLHEDRETDAAWQRADEQWPGYVDASLQAFKAGKGWTDLGVQS